MPASDELNSGLDHKNDQEPRSAIYWLDQAALFISLAMYLSALLLPALRWGSHSTPGWLCALLGPLAMIYLHIEVLSNVFFFQAVVCLAKGEWKTARNASALALLIACETFLMFIIAVPTDSGGTHYLIGVDSGFYCWIGSMALVGSYSLWRLQAGGK